MIFWGGIKSNAAFWGGINKAGFLSFVLSTACVVVVVEFGVWEGGHIDVPLVCSFSKKVMAAPASHACRQIATIAIVESRPTLASPHSAYEHSHHPAAANSFVVLLCVE